MKNPDKYKGFETLMLHAGQRPDPVTGAVAAPLYQTTTYAFDTAEEGRALFALEQPGNIYTRIMNPTNAVLEERMAVLEGGVGALAVASGAAAIMYAILTVARAGDEIVSSRTLYGGTFNMFKYVLRDMGITARFVDINDAAQLEAAINERTRAVYFESIGNPAADVCDIEQAVRIAHSHGVLTICDSTFTTPYLLRPIDWGCDVVLHSATKYLCGHATSLGGVVIDGGNFDFDTARYPSMTEPSESYHGMRFAKDFGAAGYITKMRTALLRDTGACISPFNSWLILQGVETLSLRMERHVSNAVAAAEFLAAHPKVERVWYPTLPSSPYKPLADKYLPRGAGGIFSFDIKGGVDAGRRFTDSLELFTMCANVADAKSLVIHPASTTHSQLSEAELLAGGISGSMIRLSIGLESEADILADLKQALG